MLEAAFLSSQIVVRIPAAAIVSWLTPSLQSPSENQTPNDSLRNQRHTKAVADDTSRPSKRIIYLEAKSKTSRKYLIFFSYMRPARDIAAFCHD